MRVLGFYVIVLSTGQLAAQYLVAVRKERVYSVITIIFGILNLLLLVLLIPIWSALGAAVAVLASHGFGIATLTAITLRHLLGHSTDRMEMA